MLSRFRHQLVPKQTSLLIRKFWCILFYWIFVILQIFKLQFTSGSRFIQIHESFHPIFWSKSPKGLQIQNLNIKKKSPYWKRRSLSPNPHKACPSSSKDLCFCETCLFSFFSPNPSVSRGFIKCLASPFIYKLKWYPLGLYILLHQYSCPRPSDSHLPDS